MNYEQKLSIILYKQQKKGLFVKSKNIKKLSDNKYQITSPICVKDVFFNITLTVEKVKFLWIFTNYKSYVKSDVFPDDMNIHESYNKSFYELIEKMYSEAK